MARKTDKTVPQPPEPAPVALTTKQAFHAAVKAGTLKIPNEQPLGARVLVRRDDSEKVTEGGIVLPGVALEKQTTGVVVRLGTGRVKGEPVSFDVEVGDRVRMAAWAGNSQNKQIAENYVIVADTDLLSIIRD